MIVDTDNTTDTTDVINPDEGIDTTRQPKNIPISEILDLRKRKPPLSLSQIARVLGCSKQNIHDRLRDFDADGYERFRKSPDDVYEILQHRIISKIDDVKIAKSNLQQSVWSLGVLEDKKRLIRNETTEVIDVNILVTNIQERRKRRDELLKIVEMPFNLDVTSKVGGEVCIVT